MTPEHADRRFPILRTKGQVERGVPRSIPWAAIEPHRARAHKNHDQTLERLAERGGLDLTELWWVVHDRPWDSPAPYDYELEMFAFELAGDTVPT